MLGWKIGRGMAQRYTLVIDGIRIDVVRKRIKNLNLRVSSRDATVRVSVPVDVDDKTVEQSILSKLDWIRRKRQEFAALSRRSLPVQYISGEKHYVAGDCYRLRVVEHSGTGSVAINDDVLLLVVRPGADSAQRQAQLERWYRQQLKKRIPELLEKWQPVVGVQASEWRIRKMKTRWGSCNIQARRIWLNLELAKKPKACLEYVLVHELAHLLERHHNSRFWGLMDDFMPQWRQYRAVLNSNTSREVPVN